LNSTSDQRLEQTIKENLNLKAYAEDLTDQLRNQESELDQVRDKAKANQDHFIKELKEQRD